jgi:hypothetical protein
MLNRSKVWSFVSTIVIVYLPARRVVVKKAWFYVVIIAIEIVVITSCGVHFFR